MSLPSWLHRQPGKIVCVGLNYRSHLLGRPVPERPELFFKPPSAIISAGESIVLPPDSERVEAEGELAVVIGRQGRNLTVDEAPTIVAGYTCALDVTERTWQKGDRQWWRAKGCDTFCPLGPELSPTLAPDAAIATRLNGDVAQEGTVADLIFGIAEVLAFASRYFTWEPWDLLLTGTPGQPPPLSGGDLVELNVSGLAPLKCQVK